MIVCIDVYLIGFRIIKLPFNESSLKEKLGLKRSAKIPLSKIPEIEKMLKYEYKINVSGDYIYNSEVDSLKIINLKLENEHYLTPAIPLERTVAGIAFAEKKPLFYLVNDKNDYYEVYDGIKERTMNLNEFKSLRESYINWKEYAEKANELTGGVINFYKTGTIIKTVLKYFFDLNKTIQAETLNQAEAEIIDHAKIAPLIWAKKYQGPVWKYDVCSMYPSIMKSPKFMIPYKKGIFKTLTAKKFNELGKNVEYGIYHCKIRPSGNKKTDRYFRFNRFDYYTHIDIKLAYMLNLKIKLIEKPSNFLYYPPETLISGEKLFGEYIDTCFKLKKNKVSCGKPLLNNLWGTLCSKNEKKETSDGYKEIRIPDNHDLLSITPFTNKKISVRHCSLEKRFKTEYARIGPFLLAKARILMAKICLKHINKIVRVHTDGFMATECLDLYSASHGMTGNNPNIGDLKDEGYHLVSIKNSVQIHYFD